MIVVTITDPTDPIVYLQQTRQANNEKLLTDEEINSKIYVNYCHHEFIAIGKFTKHCKTCNRCAKDFDHHCIWVNNCIGGANYQLFIWMVCAFCVQEAIYISLMTTYIVKENQVVLDSVSQIIRDYYSYVILGISICGTLFIYQLLFFHGALRICIGPQASTFMFI